MHGSLLHINNWHKKSVLCLSLIILTLFLVNIARLTAQISYPFHYYQSYANISLYNPSASGLSAPIELVAGNHSYISYLSAQYSYCNGNIRFGMGKSNPNIFNTVGFRFTGYNEGKYISGTRLYGVYSFHAKLNNRLCFAGGIDLGYIHSRIEGTPSTGFLSEYVFDGNAGIIFYNRSFHAGISVNQLTNNFIKPLQEMIVLYRHITFSASKRFTLHENFQVSPFTWFCFPYFDDIRLDIGTKLQLFKNYNMAFSYRFKEMASMGIGVQQIAIGKGYMSACITYNTPIRSRVIHTSTIEITMGFSFYGKQAKNGYFFIL
jgi:hypothetical protein